jgi:hypothetical protein
MFIRYLIKVSTFENCQDKLKVQEICTKRYYFTIHYKRHFNLNRYYVIKFKK